MAEMCESRGECVRLESPASADDVKRDPSFMPKLSAPSNSLKERFTVEQYACSRSSKTPEDGIRIWNLHTRAGNLCSLNRLHIEV